MKKTAIALLGLVIILGLVVIYVLRSTDAANLERTETVIELPDTFEK